MYFVLKLNTYAVKKTLDLHDIIDLSCLWVKASFCMEIRESVHERAQSITVGN